MNSVAFWNQKCCPFDRVFSASASKGECTYVFWTPNVFSFGVQKTYVLDKIVHMYDFWTPNVFSFGVQKTYVLYKIVRMYVFWTPNIFSFGVQKTYVLFFAKHVCPTIWR